MQDARESLTLASDEHNSTRNRGTESQVTPKTWHPNGLIEQYYA